MLLKLSSCQIHSFQREGNYRRSRRECNFEEGKKRRPSVKENSVRDAYLILGVVDRTLEEIFLKQVENGTIKTIIAMGVLIVIGSILDTDGFASCFATA